MNTDRTVSLQDAWRASLARELGPEGLFDVVRMIEEDGLFKNWSRTAEPVFMLWLNHAVDLLCGAPSRSS